VPEPLFHSQTAFVLKQYIAQPSQAVMLTGPNGIGKLTAARYLAAGLLQVDSARLDLHPYLKIVTPDKPESMTIEQVRELQHYLTLKVPGVQDHHTSRVVILENAHLLTLDAQNALLKTLEEPPEKTVILLTVAVEQSLLPTVRSRLQTLPIMQPPKEQLTAYFTEQDYPVDAVIKALRIGGNLPGLITALLQQDTEHPLLAATETARNVLQATRFDRLAQIDELSKNKVKLLDTLSILQHMAETALKQQPALPAQERWSLILLNCHNAQAALLKNAQPKLVLINLMLSL
jgi:DNA polymerase-3 subunit delta'